MSEALLLFLAPGGGFEGWLHLAGGASVARGAVHEDLPVTGKAARTVAVVPGGEVSLHWLEVPAGLAPAQSAAAARLLAAELSAEAPGELHIAVGRAVEGSPLRCVALVRAEAMSGWLAELAAVGVDPDAMVPETLLLAPPGEGVVRFGRGDVSLYRGAEEAFALEPELAQILLAGRRAEDIDGAGFEAGLHQTLFPPLLDLRQGGFARRRQWRPDRARLRRLAWLAAAIVAATLAIPVATILRYTFAADAIEAETRRVAAGALPNGDPRGDPAQALAARLSELRGGGAGYGATAAALFEAVRVTPSVELSALSFTNDGSLRATVMGESSAAIAALSTRIEGAGFEVESGPTRSGGGRQVADLTVRAR